MRREHTDSFSPMQAVDMDQAAFAAATVSDHRREPAPAGKPAVLDEVLIEEVSIDGMCGVY